MSGCIITQGSNQTWAHVDPHVTLRRVTVRHMRFHMSPGLIAAVCHSATRIRIHQQVAQGREVIQGLHQLDAGGLVGLVCESSLDC